MLKTVTLLLCLTVLTTCYRKPYHHHHADDHDEPKHERKTQHEHQKRKQESHEDQYDEYDYHIKDYYDDKYEPPVVKVPSKPLPVLLPQPTQGQPGHKKQEERKVHNEHNQHKEHVHDDHKDKDLGIVRVNPKPIIKKDEKKGQLLDLTTLGADLKAFKDKKIKELDILPIPLPKDLKNLKEEIPKRIFPEPLLPLPPVLLQRIIPYTKVFTEVKQD